MDYRTGSHTKYKLEYHFVWVTKYRYQMLQGDVAIRLREWVRQTCVQFEIEIIRGVVSKDHVHILVSAPPVMSPSEIMRRIKGRSSSKLFEEFPHLKKRYWGRHFWARGYFCVTAGELTKEMINEYLSHHFEETDNPNFEIEWSTGLAGISGLSVPLFNPPSLDGELLSLACSLVFVMNVVRFIKNHQVSSI